MGVNPDLYYLVFGESLLNDGMAVVIYDMMKVFSGLENAGEEISGGQVLLGIMSFFTVAGGGLLVGVIFGIGTALLTRQEDSPFTLHQVNGRNERPGAAGPLQPGLPGLPDRRHAGLVGNTQPDRLWPGPGSLLLQEHFQRLPGHRPQHHQAPQLHQVLTSPPSVLI